MPCLVFHLPPCPSRLTPIAESDKFLSKAQTCNLRKMTRQSTLFKTNRTGYAQIIFILTDIDNDTCTLNTFTFFSWNLMVALVSSTFVTRESWCEIGVGNFPALFKPGPKILGICLIKESDARKALYFFAGRR